MNTTIRNVLIALGVLVISIVFAVSNRKGVPVSVAPQPIASATFACNAGKSIAASFYEGAAAAAPVRTDQPPVPTGSVMLTLSDGRTMTLAQTISADGARYANADESIVFWNKGRGVLFTENNTQTFMGCIEVAKDPGGLSQIYQNSTEGFSLRYPTGFTVDTSYTYQALGPRKNIGGVKFTIPATLAAGTNLSSDSYVSVEEIPGASVCSAAAFLGAGATTSTTDDAGTTYSIATLSDAAAGNRYDETVFAIPGTNPCIAVRYFIHYGVIENYPPGVVIAFNKQALMTQFDAIRRTLVVL